MPELLELVEPFFIKIALILEMTTSQAGQDFGFIDLTSDFKILSLKKYMCTCQWSSIKGRAEGFLQEISLLKPEFHCCAESWKLKHETECNNLGKKFH